jgi:hypothetical protein
MLLFLETATVTVPGPVPAAPADTTAHETGLVADQVHAVPSVTPTAIDVAEEAIVWPFEDSV